MTAAAETRYLDLQEFEVIKDFVEQNWQNPELQIRLREHWPQFRFILCSELDMDAKPEYDETEHSLYYLMASSLGCAAFTQEYEQAIGVVIAIKEG